MSTETRIVVVADLSPNFHGAPTMLPLPFGRSSSLLAATLERLCATGLARVVVAYRDSDHNRALQRLCRGLDVELCMGPQVATPPDLALAVIEKLNLSRVLLIDPRAAFVSPTILSALLSAHASSAKELALCPTTPRGLCGVVASRGPLARLQAMYVAERFLDPEIDLFACIDKLRSAFDAIDVGAEERYLCVPATLLPSTEEEVAAHAAHQLEPGSEDYGPLFSKLCEREWRRFDALAPPVATLSTMATKTRPKIAFASYCTDRDQGTTLSFEVVLEHWDRARWDGVLLLPGAGALRDRYQGRWPIRTVRFRPFTALADPTERERWADEVAGFLCVIDEERPDVVYVAGTVTPLALACRIRGVPILSHMHVPLSSMPPRVSGAALRAAGLPMYDLVVSPSEWFERNLRVLYRPPRGRLTAVQCGTDLVRFDPARISRGDARRQLGLPENGKIVAMIGTLTGHKRPELAIAMLPQLLARAPEALIVFAGVERAFQPGYQSILEAQAKALGVDRHIKFLGFIDAVETLHAASDLLLHCGLVESFGMVLVEAMLMERPVVAFASRGPIEIVVDGETGRLLPAPGDPAALAEAIAEILCDPLRARQLGQAGAKRARERFGDTLFVERIEHLCARLMHRQPIEDERLGIRA